MTDRELAQVRNANIGFIFQTFNLLPRMTALRNVELPAGLRRCRAPRAPRTRRCRAGPRRPGGPRAAPPQPALRGAQRQRVAIARALVNDPSIVFADEPTGNLDSATGRDIMQLLAQLHGSGATIILVTHEAEVAACAARVIHLRDGRITQRRGAAAPASRRLGSPGMRFTEGLREAFDTVRHNKLRNRADRPQHRDRRSPR